MSLEQIGTPLWEFQLLRLAKQKANQRNRKDKRLQAVEIIIFSHASLEAFANREISDVYPIEYAKILIRDEKFCDKWKRLLKKVGIELGNKEGQQASTCIKKLNDLRNSILHFKPHENLTRKIFSPKKRTFTYEGEQYIDFKKRPSAIIREGVLNSISLTMARKFFKDTDAVMRLYFRGKRAYPARKEYFKKMLGWSI